MVPVYALWGLPGLMFPPLKPWSLSLSLAGAPGLCISVVPPPVVNATEGLEGAAGVGVVCIQVRGKICTSHEFSKLL